MGFQAEASADAGVAKADYKGQSDFFGILKAKLGLDYMEGLLQ